MMKPKRGEVWLVEFEPQRGAEILKTRPAVVLSIKEIDKIPIRIVVPIREYKTHHEHILFFITLKQPGKTVFQKLAPLIALKLNLLPLNDL